MLISLKQWKAFRFKKEAAFRGNDQYSQGVRDTLAVVDEFLERSGRGDHACEKGFHDELQGFLRSENEKRFRGIPKDMAKDLKLELQTTEIVEDSPFNYRGKILVTLKRSEAHNG
ncbi:MAG TPA: hypothetical protein H9795_01500 [Candidatus Fournierella merdigallinarum]|nr:hypothetical protein [Candidatus Fournierella merdigallinarum]